MMPPSDNHQQFSLFAPTSAFDRPELEAPPPAALVQPVPRDDYKEIVELLEEALDGSTDDEVLPLLREALELARRHV